MDISKSIDTTARWAAEVRLFSGRRNPRWLLTVRQGAEMLAIWKGLRPRAAAAAAIPTPPLGYSGAALTDCRGDTWLAFDRHVSYNSRGGLEVRVDASRTFEAALLATAPPETLPSELLNDLPSDVRSVSQSGANDSEL